MSVEFRGSIAGKAFLLGEYAVLAGEPALLAAVGPRFELRAAARAAGAGGGAAFPAGSPAARLLERAGGSFSIEFVDPYSGAGGFGASTAQFALAYELGRFTGGEAEKSHEAWTDALPVYRDLAHTPGGLPPSGADMVAQWRGGVTVFTPAGAERAASARSVACGAPPLLVWSATGTPGRKTPTHVHLVELAARGLLAAGSELVIRLHEPLHRGIAAMERGDWRELGAAFTDTADILYRFDLECAATHAERRRLAALPGVWGVKGTGALQSDAIVALMDPDASAEQWKTVADTARELGLKPLATEGGAVRIAAGIDATSERGTAP